MSPIIQDALIVSGSVIGVLVVLFLLFALVIVQCRRSRSHHHRQKSTRARKLTPDLIQHNVSPPPPLEHQLDDRQVIYLQK